MKKVSLSEKHLKLIKKAIRYTIADLQFEKREAQKHGCSGNSYDNEIEEYQQLKTIVQ